MPDPLYYISRMKAASEQKKGYAGPGIYRGIIHSVSGASENCNLEYVGGGPCVIPLSHPFQSGNAWIRAIPTTDSKVLINVRVDTKDATILSYFDSNQKENLEKFKIKYSLYRPLVPGEIEVASEGGAQTYWSRLPHLEDNVGVCSRWLSQTFVESGAKAPVHVRVLHNNIVGNLTDIERFGVVKRYVPGFATRELYIRWATPPGFAKEYLRVIGTNIPSPAPLDRFEDFRVGCVVEDTGIPGLSTFTAQPLRMRHKLFTPTGEYSETSVDELGNWNLTLPTTAVLGANLNIPLGGLALNIGTPGFKTVVQGPYTVASTTTVDFQTPLFNVGTAKNEPAVLGAALRTILNLAFNLILNHQHLGNLGVLTLPDPAFLAAFQTQINSIQNPAPPGAVYPIWLSEFMKFSKVP